MIRRSRLLLAPLVALWMGSSLAAPQSAPTGLHPGPAAWLEEYWDVKPGKLDEFVGRYREEVYARARKLPGYRGYTVLTNLPDPAAPSHPNLFGEQMIAPHYGVHLNGKVRTGRAINIGNLLRRTHNVVIIHHLQTWADRDPFRQKLGTAYEKVYPLANNVWEADFRLIETGLRAELAQGGQDADGLDLDPRPSDTGWYKEYFDVDATELAAFLRAYDETYAVMKPIPGYRGVTIVTTLAPDAAEAARTKYANRVLGAPGDLFVPRPGMLMDGTIRTDTSINFSSLFAKTYTIITYYEVPWDTKLLPMMQKNWEALGNKGDRIEHVTKTLFPHARNHWDMQYRAIETSFAPTARDARHGAAEQPAAWLGTWDADIAHSTFKGRAPYRSGTMAVTAEGGMTHVVCDVVTANGAAFHFEYRDPQDGTDVPVTGNPYYDSESTVWTDLFTATRTERRRGEIIGKTIFVVAPDGMSYTATSSRTTPEDGHLYTSVILWKRRAR
jgi:hypothetical protein